MCSGSQMPLDHRRTSVCADLSPVLCAFYLQVLMILQETEEGQGQERGEGGGSREESGENPCFAQCLHRGEWDLGPPDYCVLVWGEEWAFWSIGHSWFMQS